MSTTSCPRCSAQVTLPVGVSNDATVRCPLCHAHYTLADALVNMPPLLEVVGGEGESLAADWLDEPQSKRLVDDDSPIATALPIDEMDEEASEAETLELGSLELGSLELDDEPVGGIGQETVAEDLGFSTIESPDDLQPKAAIPADDDDVLDGDDILGELSGDDLTAGPAEEEELPLDFGEELSAEAAGAETMAFSADSLAEFEESDAGELKFDLDSEADDAGGATIDFSAPLEEQAELGKAKDDELAFDSFDSEGETVRFEPDATGFGGEDLKFDDPLASEAPEGDELREFEDLRFEPSNEATDAPEVMPVAAVMAATPVEAAEELKGKKGKKEKKKKEKKVKVKAEGGGEKRKRSLVGILVGVLIAIPAALYGLLWLGKDYDIGLSAFLPAVVLPAEYSKQTVVAQNYVPSAALPSGGDPTAMVEEPASDAATETPAEEVPADAAMPAEELPAGDESTAHTTARPATDDPAASEEMPADATADVAPSLAEPAPADALPADAPADAAAPADDDLFAPATDTPAEAPAESDPFAPAADTAAETTAPATDAAADPFAPAADAPAAEAPTESDPFAPAADTPAEPAAEPADDLFAPAPDAPAADAPAEAMPAEETPAAPAEDDLFAPATDAPAADPAAADPTAPEEADPFAPAAAEAPAETPAEMPIENDPFAPAAEPAAEPAALPADTTRPAEPDPFAPEPVTPAEEMPAAEDPADPLTDTPAPAEEDVLRPAPAEEMPATPAEDPLSIPAEPSAPELPTDAPAEPTFPSPAADRVGPRNVQPVSPTELTGAMQSAFVANQQLIAAEAAADEAQLRKARAAFYVNLFGMAEAITAAQQGAGAAELDPQLQQLATILKQQLASDPRRLESLKVFGARWIGFPKRTTDGVVVSGTVESAEQVGQLFHTKARLGSGADAPLVTIVSATDPQLARGDAVVALGSIVERPTEEIAGYQGSDPTVVWSGMAMKLPAN